MNAPRLLIALLLAALLSACATEKNHYDPIEPVNRGTDKVNDTIDRLTLKPLAVSYTYVTPKPIRLAVSNFYSNATYLNTVLNDFLQGKGAQGMSDLGRFLINTTLGVGGLVDVASYMGMERHNEDFGQTLAVWGAGEGAYIVYPLFGPNSVRKTPDFITSTATDPLFWAGFALAPYITIPLTAMKYIDQRANLLEASDARDELALDPYVFTREAYRQNREFQIYDGNPPAKVSDSGWGDDDWGDEDSGATASASEARPRTSIRLEAAPTDMPASATSGAPLAMEHQLAKPAPRKRYITIIHLSSHQTRAEATAAQLELASHGVQSEIHEVNVLGTTWYRLRYHGKLQGNVKEQLEQLKEKTGVKSAWIETIEVK